MDRPPKQVLVELEYTSGRESKPVLPLRNEMAFRVAMVCWGLPLGAGLLVFLIFKMVRSDAVLIAGAVVICFGFIVSVIGFLSAMMLMIIRWYATNRPIREALLPALGLILLQGSNYLAAYFCLMASHI